MRPAGMPRRRQQLIVLGATPKTLAATTVPPRLSMILFAAFSMPPFCIMQNAKASIIFAPSLGRSFLRDHARLSRMPTAASQASA